MVSGRFNGTLAVARAIGDRDTWYQGPISGRSKITSIDKPEKGFLILGCDGIFDVASSTQVAKGVRDHADRDVGLLAETIVRAAYQANSQDNLSVLVIDLSQDRSAS